MRAAFWGKIVGYYMYGDYVEIENAGNVCIHISIDTFDYLYLTLDEHHAALKEDCIEYTTFSIDKPYYEYPDWFIDAWNNGDLYINGDIALFYDNKGEIAMSPNSVILRNFMGQLMYMERERFERYYDTLEE